VTELEHPAPEGLPELHFRDAEAAARNLASLRPLVPEKVYESLLALLPAAPDPDAVVNQFERLAEAAWGNQIIAGPETSASATAGREMFTPATAEGEGMPEVLRLLEKHLSLVHYAVVVSGYSPWLGETLIHNPDLFYSFVRERRLDRTHSREELQEDFARMRSRSFETDTAALLARFKRREYIRIMLRDVLGIATLAETTAEISALADVIIEEALREANSLLQHRFGAPRRVDAEGRVVDSRFAVLSLGKLGGNELNYSSDVDLLYLYEGGVEPEGAETSNREYFIRLAQHTTELLSRHTREGPVFRIDLRLRPQGGEGEPAVPLAHAIDYYSQVAHDWELQAMIKARHSAGDLGLAREFVRAVQPYVYRPEVNFVAIKTALETREKIGSHRRRSLLQQAVPKPRLSTSAVGALPERSRGAVVGVDTGIDVKLDRGGIRDIEFLVQCLQRVYGGSEAWLRSRGTLFALQKLHDKEHISGKDFQNLTTAYEFLRNLEHRLQLQHGQQTHCLPQSNADLQALARSLTREGTVALTAEEFLQQVQRRMAAVAEIYQRVIYREQSQDQGALKFELQPEVAATPENSYSQMMQRLAVDSPRLHEIASRDDLSQHARRNLDRFLSSAGTTSERYGALLRSPEAVEQALSIFELSEFLTEVLVRHPEEVLLLDRIGEGSSAGEQGLFAANWQGDGTRDDSVFAYLSRQQVDRSEAMSILRRHYRRRMFLSGALDLFQPRDVFDAFDDYTSAADAAVQAALGIAGFHEGLAVMGLGRLGAREFDLLSDADMLFVADDESDRQEMRRAAERLMETLTAYTRDGTVFPVDARLRPHGREGELVVTAAQLAAYFRDEAKPWEALTYLKLRSVAGDRAVANRALQVVQDAIWEMARQPDFHLRLAEVRDRLERSEAAPNFKAGAGGVYDLDYLAGSLQARHQLWLAGNLRDRLRLLRDSGVLEEEEHKRLAESAGFLRTLEHIVRLVTGRPRKWLPVAEHPRRAVQKLLWRVMGGNDSLDPETQLKAVLRQTREIYGEHRID
jgi:glutamate-ammonia-ligase adenylyltransferase